MIALSYSAIKAYRSCPMRFKLQYIDKVPAVHIETEALKEGKLAHEVLEHIYNLSKELPPAEALKRAVEEYAAELAERQRVKALIKKIDPNILYRPEVIRHGAAEKRIGLTRELEPTEFDAPDVAFRGIIDMLWFEEIDGVWTLQILDYKTNTATKPDIEQLEFYAFLAYHYYKHDTPIEQIRAAIMLLSEEGYLVHGLDFTPATIPTAKYLDLYEELTTRREWPVYAGPWCHWCPVAAQCPLAEPTEPQTEQELVDKYIATKAALARLEEQLRRALEEKGKLEGTVAVVEYTKYRSGTIKKDAFVEAAKRANIPYEELLNEIRPTQNLIKRWNLELSEDAFEYTYRQRIDVKKKEE